MAKKVLVLGATGNVGTPLVTTLQAHGQQVKAASRSGKIIGNSEATIFDYLDPGTFDSAFTGVDRVFVILPAGFVHSKEMLIPVVEAAAARHIKVVLLSVFGVDADDSIPYRQVEIALEESATPYVILRPNWFADNFHTFWKAGIDHGQIALPAGEGKSSFIDVRDIANSAAAALMSDRFNGAAYDLTGPKAHSYSEAVSVLSKAIGKPVTYTHIADNTFISMLISAGVAEDYAQFLASIFYPVREGWTSKVTNAVETLTGKPPRSLTVYAEDHLAELTAK